MRLPRIRFTVRRMRVMAAVAVISLLGGSAVAWRAAWIQSHGPLPLSRSTYLRGVVEPIRMERGVSWDDGGSLGLRFLDADGTDRSVCLARPLDSGRVFLILGQIGDDGGANGGGNAELTSDDARALLGLLERWSASRFGAAGNPDRGSSATIFDSRRRADQIASGILEALRRFQ